MIPATVLNMGDTLSMRKTLTFALGRSLEYYDLCAVAQITSMKGDSMNTVEPRQARFSIPSLIALVAAICSFVTGAFWGFVLACTAILFGLLGLVLSFLPSIRGGFVSILSLVAGLIGLVLAIFKAAIWLF